MQDKLYCLSIREFLDAEMGEAYIQRAFACVDEERRQKAERIKQPAAKAACLGAGLLLQLALQEALGGAGRSTVITRTVDLREPAKAGTSIEATAKDYALRQYSVSELFRCLDRPRSLEFVRGEHGKPYLKDYPFYFNLSHSGEYVVCVLSAHEVGVDIQQHREDDVLRLAKRFFSEGECKALDACPKEARGAFFFRLWTKKEAYGKLTGEGVAEVLGLDLEEKVSEIAFEEYTDIPGYSIAVCKKKNDSNR